MLTQLLQERCSVWQRLYESKKPIFLYGMGDGACKIMQVCAQYHIPIAGIFASDEFVRGHSFAGYPVLRFDQAKAQFGDFFAVLAFGVHDSATIAHIHTIASQVELVAPDVPIAGQGLFTPQYLQEHLAQFERTYALLADEFSRQTFLRLLNFKISGKIDYLQPALTDRQEIYTQILRPGPDWVYVDLGAYDGDTVREYLQYAKSARAIYAWEPDPRNFRKLQRNIRPQDYPFPVVLRQVAASSDEQQLYFCSRAGRNSALQQAQAGLSGGKVTTVAADSIDHAFAGQQVDLIKMDLEGGEMQAIAGAAKTIAGSRPKLMNSAYHRNEDLFALPLQIAKLYAGYRFYLRQQQYIPAWESNYYALADR